MPHTPDVSAFLETLGNFYELVDEEEALAAEVEATSAAPQVNGQSQSIRRSIKLAASRMQRNRSSSGSFSGPEEAANGAQRRPPAAPVNGSGLSSPDSNLSEDDEDEEDDEEFCDVASTRSLASLPRADAAVELANGLTGDQLVSSGGALSQHILRALSRLEQDVHSLSSRLDAMERLLRSRLPPGAPTAAAAVTGAAGSGGSGGGNARDPARPPWWWQLPFDRLALRNVAFIVLWPLVVQLLARFLLRRLRGRNGRRSLTQ